MPCTSVPFRRSFLLYPTLDQPNVAQDNDPACTLAGGCRSTEDIVILHFKDDALGLNSKHRCSRKALREGSQYFDVLLDPAKFREGVATQERIDKLIEESNIARDVSWDELPIITISCLPRLATDTEATVKLLNIFLTVLHQSIPAWPFKRARSLDRLAQLLSIADRFSAVDSIKEYVKETWSIQLNVAGSLRPKAAANEEYCRYQIYIGYILEYPKWVQVNSARLIVTGSRNWQMQDEDRLEQELPAWKWLPWGIEEELMARRNYALRTISSVQKHFVSLYCSKNIQCKKGYADSMNCDSYHLGEMVKFFTGKGTLGVQCMFTQSPTIDSVNSLTDIIKSLKECPSYQMNTNHTRCGVRQRMMPILVTLETVEKLGLCLPCWKANGVEESWLDSPFSGKWIWLKKPPRMRSPPLECAEHEILKEMYTAEERDWTPEQ